MIMCEGRKGRGNKRGGREGEGGEAEEETWERERERGRGGGGGEGEGGSERLSRDKPAPT